MARPALSASRSIDILDFLATFPDRSFTLSEIARVTKINAASCHAVLAVLNDRGYIARSADQRSYTLGAVPVALGRAALSAQPLIARAIAAADELFAEFQIPTMITQMIGDEIVCLHSRAHGARHSGMTAGDRRPLIPPMGGTFLAWSSDEDIDRWIARHDPPVTPEMIAAWRHTLALTRQRGAQVTLRGSDDMAVASLMAKLAAGSHLPDYKDEVSRLFNAFDGTNQPEAIEPDRLYDIILIAAPVFTTGGDVACSLCFGGFTEPLKGAVVLDHAARLARTCLRITREDRV